MFNRDFLGKFRPCRLIEPHTITELRVRLSLPIQEWKFSDFRQNGILNLRLSPDWIKIITNIKAKRTKPDDIKTTGAILQDFFATSFPSSIFETLLTPYYVSVWNGNLSHVLFLWSFIKDKNPHIGKYFIQNIHKRLYLDNWPNNVTFAQ